MTELELPDGMGPAEALRGLADDLLAPDAKLRAFVDFGKEERWDSGPLKGATHGGFLRLVADLIDRKTTRNPADDVTMSAYDLLPECDRKAISLALDCGGVEEIKKRLMPAGVEWPRFEDGEPVKPGCEFTDGAKGVRTCTSVEIFACEDGVRDALVHWDGDDPDNALLVCMASGERVKRPAPKILAADGKPLCEGETVYLLPGEWCGKFPLFGYYGGDEMRVIRLHTRHESGGIECRKKNSLSCYAQPSQLTHERPDSWELLEGDARKSACMYFAPHVEGCDGCPVKQSGKSCNIAKDLDLVRRAKKLAGVSE